MLKVASIPACFHRRSVRSHRTAEEADENYPLSAYSPYSASKAGSDFWRSPISRPTTCLSLVTSASNNYGPHQFPKKLIPLMISNAIEDKPLPITATACRFAIGCMWTIIAGDSGGDRA